MPGTIERKMKDSGVEWIGQIPEDWTVQRGKAIFAQKNDKGNSKSLVLLSPTQNYGVIPQDLYEELSGFSAVKLNDKTDYNSLKTVHKGAFVISLRSFQGGFEYSKYEGVVSPAYQVFYPIVPVCDGYYKYLFKTDAFIGKMNSFTMSLRDGKNIAFDDFGRSYIPVPPLRVQEQLADFLDSKCTEIDTLRSDIAKEIETLEEYKRSIITEAVTKGLDPNVPMKDSGIKWVGQIPEHWAVDKGKYCLRYLEKPTRPDDDVITCFRDGEVTLRKNRREEGFTISLQEIGYQGIDVGDLIVHGMDGFAGAIGISDSRGKASPVLNVLDTDNNKRYIMYYLRNMAYNGVFIALATGIRVRTCDTNWGKLRELPYTLPPKEEQDAIAEFIDNRLTAVDAVIEEKRNQLDTLDSYKKSMIYEYVTGKKEVPDA